ncbi:MAG: response regulator transcription factor [Rhodobacteraceae bacterium]|nr:response regulator transcription factor [Paracoccaceae bacterium]
MSGPAPHVLVVDDDPHIRDVIAFALEDAGMAVTQAADGQRGVTEAQRLAPDLVVMDIGMPELDGFGACRAIRRTSAVPILFLTARDDEIDRVLGFEFGADDYVCKPFSTRELVLRIRAILARGKAAAGAGPLRHGDLVVDPASHRCTLGDRELELTATEFSILTVFLEAPERVISRDGLIHAVYGAHAQHSGRTVDSHIRNIRSKAAALGSGDVLVTVHGVGVKLGACRS